MDDAALKFGGPVPEQLTEVSDGHPHIAAPYVSHWLPRSRTFASPPVAARTGINGGHGSRRADDAVDHHGTAVGPGSGDDLLNPKQRRRNHLGPVIADDVMSKSCRANS